MNNKLLLENHGFLFDCVFYARGYYAQNTPAGQDADTGGAVFSESAFGDEIETLLRKTASLAETRPEYAPQLTPRDLELYRICLDLTLGNVAYTPFGGLEARSRAMEIARQCGNAHKSIDACAGVSVEPTPPKAAEVPMSVIDMNALKKRLAIHAAEQKISQENLTPSPTAPAPRITDDESRKDAESGRGETVAVYEPIEADLFFRYISGKGVSYDGTMAATQPVEYAQMVLGIAGNKKLADEFKVVLDAAHKFGFDSLNVAELINPSNEDPLSESAINKLPNEIRESVAVNEGNERRQYELSAYIYETYSEVQDALVSVLRQTTPLIYAAITSGAVDLSKSDEVEAVAKQWPYFRDLCLAINRIRSTEERVTYLNGLIK